MRNNFLSIMLGLIILSIVSISCAPAIGDKGQGGGIVFYINPNADSDGWKYLEVSSSDLGLREVMWGCEGKLIGTSTNVGEGKNNTKLILEKCDNKNSAAYIAANYTAGGKNDWYLPSIEELDLIFKNLHEVGKGKFNGITYWSSSEEGRNTAWVQVFLKNEHYGARLNPNKNYLSTNSAVRPIRAYK